MKDKKRVFIGVTAWVAAVAVPLGLFCKFMQTMDDVRYMFAGFFLPFAVTAISGVYSGIACKKWAFTLALPVVFSLSGALALYLAIGFSDGTWSIAELIDSGVLFWMMCYAAIGLIAAVITRVIVTAARKRKGGFA